MVQKKYSYCLFSILFCAILSMCTLSSCSKEHILSNKKERNAVKKGNKSYGKREFSDALQSYKEAIEANPQSEIAKLNLALAAFQSTESDSTDRAYADSLLIDLASSASNPDVLENALYNRSNILVYYGDALKEQVEKETDQGMAQEMSNKSTELYKGAIEGYKELLRRRPGDLKVTQNLRIVQLKLPPQQDGGGGDNDQNQDQDQDQNQDQEKEQNQNQDQQQQQQPQADALNALQKREAQTRKRQTEPVTPVVTTTNKPW